LGLYDKIGYGRTFHILSLVFLNNFQYFYADNTHGQTWKM